MRTLLLLPFAIAAVFVPAAATGAAFTFPNFVNNGGGAFYLSDNTYANGAILGSGGFGLTDAEFANASDGLDAFDGAFVMRVNGSLFATPSGGATLTGNTLSTTANTYAGISTSAQFTFLGTTNPILRTVYTFQNVTAGSLNATLSLEVNLGSDNLTRIGGVSGVTGTPSDRWLVSSDTAGQDAVVTMVRFGTNLNEALPTGNARYAGASGDLLTDTYQITIGANQTVQLMMFTELNTIGTGTNGATSGASVFDNYATMTSAGLLTGMDMNNLPINWVPEPSSSTLLALGGGLLWLYRRRRQR